MRLSTSVRVWSSMQLIALAVLLVAVAVLAYYAIQTHDALCDLRGDVERRAENTQRILDERPGEFPFPGIPRSELERSLATQHSTLAALSDLNC